MFFFAVLFVSLQINFRGFIFLVCVYLIVVLMYNILKITRKNYYLIRTLIVVTTLFFKLF